MSKKGYFSPYFEIDLLQDPIVMSIDVEFEIGEWFEDNGGIGGN